MSSCRATNAKIAGTTEATACGVKFEAGAKVWGGSTFSVTSKGTTTTYTLDRWD